jgi:hypothetical protein
VTLFTQKERVVDTRVANLEQQIASWRQSALAALPPHLRQLSPILRRAVRTGRVRKLARWCQKLGLSIPKRTLPLFRDYLITKMLDLKDLEPGARARLRRHRLRQLHDARPTPDYRLGVEKGEDLRCRDCRWFVCAPRDGDRSDPGDDQPCAALGAKGIDAACPGFTRN